MKRFSFLLAAIILFAFVSNGQTAVWRVKSDGVDPSSGCVGGDSWDTAFQTIQKAVSCSASFGDEIWVKMGAYTLSATVTVNKIVDIYGGFEGTETVRTERDWETNLTKIDGGNAVQCLFVTANAAIDGFTIANCSGDFGGGIRFGGGTNISPSVSNCSFLQNAATIQGGGIFNGLTNALASLTIKNCFFANNTAGFYGGGVASQGSKALISNSLFSGNNVIMGGSGGGISIWDATGNSITNCLFYGNQASSGGGIYNKTAVTAITNCTLSGNTGDPSGGGGVYNAESSAATVINSILWGNISPNNPEIQNNNSTAAVSYSNIDQTGYEGNGNMRQNPLFVDSANGDFRLQPNSPCIDAATSNGAPLTDMKGNPRFDPPWIPNTGGGTYPYYDMGALELAINKSIIDFDGDWKTDLFWRHAFSGQTAVWLMDGASYSSDSPGTVSNLNWQIKGMGDFDGDSKTDILWQDTSTGWTMIWFMDGTTLSSQQAIAQVGLTWQIKKIGDFNGDGKADVLWQDSSTGWTAIWFMDGVTVTSTGAPAKVDDPNWQIKEVADFNGDGKADILWLHTTSGWTYIWFMDGATVKSVGAPAQVGDASWQIKEVGDFNGDGKADILWQNTSSGWTYIWFMDGATISSGAAPAQVGDASWQIKCVGDFNGDGRADVFWQHTTGWTYIWFMNGATISSDSVPGVVSDSNWQIMN